MGFEVAVSEWRQIDEALVDAVDLNLAGEFFDRRDDAALHVTVERVVRAQHPDAMTIEPIADQVDGIAHFDAQRLCLVRPGDGASVVVASDHDGDANQAVVERSLAADVIVVAVDEADGGHAR